MEKYYGAFIDKGMLMSFLFNFGIFPWSYINITPNEMINIFDGKKEKKEE